MNDEQYLLANAYVDGELTADERVLAETDPDVMSEVEALLSLQTTLRRVDPPTASAREAALSAAMAVFPAAEPRPAPPINAAVRNPVPVRSRPAYARYLGLAAAVVAVGLLGTVVVTGLRSGDDDDAGLDSAAEAPTEEPADEPADEQLSPAPGRLTQSNDADMADEGEAEFADDAADEAADTADTAAGSAADDMLASEPAAEAADEPAEEPASDSDDSEQPVIDPSLPLTGPTDLGAHGAYLLELQAAGELPPTPNTDCPQQGLLGQTQYLFDGVLVEVYIAVDDQTRTVSAIDTTTCEVLVIGPLI